MFIKGKHVAELIGGESGGHVEYLLDHKEMSNIIESNVQLKERIDRALKEK